VRLTVSEYQLAEVAVVSDQRSPLAAGYSEDLNVGYRPRVIFTDRCDVVAKAAEVVGNP
jgi:hypothetical protein